MTTLEECKELDNLLDMLVDMDIPANRMNLTNQDIHWLIRNLGVRNHEHQNFDKVMKLLQKWSLR